MKKFTVIVMILMLCLPARAERVAALLGSYGEVWLEAGGELAGTTEDAVRDGVANLGSHSQPNMELLLALEPDFVILSADAAAHPAIGDLLSQAGIEHQFYSMQTWQGYMKMLAEFTQRTGRQDLFEEKIETVQRPIEEMIASAQKQDVYGKKTALLLRAYVTSVKAKGSEDTVAGPILSDLGLVNLADGENALSENIGMESILLADPDYIFIVTMGADQAGAERMLQDAFLSNPAWSTLTAVREGRCHMLDKELFHLRPNGRWAESYRIIYEMLYETE